MNIAAERSQLDGRSGVCAHGNVRRAESFGRGLNGNGHQLLVMAATWDEGDTHAQRRQPAQSLPHSLLLTNLCNVAGREKLI